MNSLEYAAKRLVQHFSDSFPIVVVSAFKGHTDELLKMHEGFCKDFSSFTITAGEQITAGLFASALQKYGKKAKPLTGWQVPIIIDPLYEDGLFVDYRKLIKLTDSGIVPVIAGFQGIDHSFEIKDLGRGGSDLTAISIAKSINSKCFLIKDVGGVCSADPSLIEENFVWNTVDYDSLVSLSYSGSKIVQQEALKIAKSCSLQLEVTSLDFSTFTQVVDSNDEFWSLVSCSKNLRLISKKNSIFLKKLGFSFFSDYGYYELVLNDDNLQNKAKEVYKLCTKNFS